MTTKSVGRVDFALSPRDQFFTRYLFQQQVFAGGFGSVAQYGNGAEGGTLDSPDRAQQIALDWTRNWTPHLVNQARFGYVRLFAGTGSGTSDPTCTTANLGNCPTFYRQAAGVSVWGLGVNLPQNRLINTSQWQDNASWQHGRHIVKFGGEYERQRSPNIFLPLTNGYYRFTQGSSTLDPVANLNALFSSTPSGFYLTLGDPKVPFKEQDAALYVGDDWRIKDNVTLNLGLRWEYNQQAINQLAGETLARESNPATALWDTGVPLSLRTVPHIPNAGHNFAPNFGFAWTPHMLKGLLGENKTVIRGGFRIAYDPTFYNMFLNVATSAPRVNAAANVPARRHARSQIPELPLRQR